MLKYILTGVVLLASQSAMAEMTHVTLAKGSETSRLLFIVQSNMKSKQIPVTVCLDTLAKKKVCQNYTAALNNDIGIRPMKYGKNTTYPHAGIRVDAKEYKIEGCKPNKNDFCIFNASTKSSKILKIVRVS